MIQGPYFVIPVTKKQSKIGRELEVFRKSTFSDLTDAISPLPKRLSLGGSISRVETVLNGEVF